MAGNFRGEKVSWFSRIEPDPRKFYPRIYRCLSAKAWSGNETTSSLSKSTSDRSSTATHEGTVSKPTIFFHGQRSHQLSRSRSHKYREDSPTLSRTIPPLRYLRPTRSINVVPADHSLHREHHASHGQYDRTLSSVACLEGASVL